MSWKHVCLFFLVIGTLSCQSRSGGNSTASESVQSEPANSVTGVISYREKKTLPPDAEVAVRLVDLNQSGENRLISEISFTTGGNQIPLDFVLPYDEADLTPNGNFALEGGITYAGMKLFQEIQPIQVIANGKEKDLVLMMRTARGKVETTE